MDEAMASFIEETIVSYRDGRQGLRFRTRGQLVRGYRRPGIKTTSSAYEPRATAACRASYGTRGVWAGVVSRITVITYLVGISRISRHIGRTLFKTPWE